MKMLNLIEYCTRTQNSAIILSVDFEKAFDKLEWDAMYKALELFNFGPCFISYVKTLYSNPISSTMNNGWWSKWFELSRSCRQGDPLVAVLFVITIEILGIKLRLNMNIKGIEMNGYEQLESMYADDLWIALLPTEENLNNFLEELQNFSKFSGLNVNYEKTVAKIIGPLKDTNAKLYSMKKLFWSDGSFRLLGINIHMDSRSLHEANYDEALEKIKDVLNSWTHRSLTIIGKITIINSLVISLLVYVSSISRQNIL